MSVRASVLVLSHDRPVLLAESVRSALNQSIADLEVLIVGDGVTDQTRASALALTADSRVRFLDYPKGENHGEAHRDTAIRDAQSNAIFYLCDDDLLLPHHIAELLELLKTHNFVQSQNCWIDDHERIRPYAADLASPDTIAWHLRDDLKYNAVSITGTAHTRDFYLSTGRPWTATPAGEWPDHYQWKKLLSHPDFSGATSANVTALQFPNFGTHRANWSEAQRRDELARWNEILAATDSATQLQSRLRVGALYELEQYVFAFRSVDAELARAYAELTALHATKSWRVTAPLRWLYRVGNRLRRR